MFPFNCQHILGSLHLMMTPLLQKCVFNVIIEYVRENKGCIDVILTEVHMTNMDDYAFFHDVTKEINVPVIIMSLNGARSVVIKAIIEGACDYWIKPLHENQFKLICKYVARKLWNQNKLPKKDDFEFTSFCELDAMVRDKKSKRANSNEFDVDEQDASFAPPPKKAPLKWSDELHHQFVKVVKQVGLEDMINS
ncbi:hypothetical protein VNO78_33609 [Psophocarpus tetragonolobus]|uniref:Response regulatory domain-containing protein n=1 Tax=Psophocarpus tetragonolobus TaxID=3891 RepID=A0AAN9NYL8_PSOTE